MIFPAQTLGMESNGQELPVIFSPLPVWFTITDYLLVLGVIGWASAALLAFFEFHSRPLHGLMVTFWMRGIAWAASCWAAQLVSLLVLFTNPLPDWSVVEVVLFLTFAFLGALSLGGSVWREPLWPARIAGMGSALLWVLLSLLMLAVFYFPHAGKLDWAERNPLHAPLAAGVAALAGFGVAGWLLLRILRGFQSISGWARRRRGLFAVSAMLGIIGAGAMIAAKLSLQWRMEQIRLRDEIVLLQRVETAALSLPEALVGALRAEPGDEKTEALGVIRNKLRGILKANPDAKFVYLWTIVGGNILFVADAAEGPGLYSPPGEIYGPAEELDRAFFESGRPYVNGPFVDKWGTFIAANAPVAESAVLPGAVWLGLDFLAADWLGHLIEARWQVLGGLLAVEILLLGIFLILVQNARSLVHAMEETELLQAERERFARDLHDGLGQTLAALGLMGSSLSLKLAETDPAASGVAMDLAGRIRGVLKEARETAHSLTPAIIEEKGLRGALDWLAFVARDHMQCDCKLEISRRVEAGSAEVAFSLFQICREAIHNATRHGGASEVIIRLQWLDGHEAVLEIEDNGMGMEKELAVQEVGFGLRMMFARVRELGGRLGSRRSPQGGLVLICRLPAACFCASEPAGMHDDSQTNPV